MQSASSRFELVSPCPFPTEPDYRVQIIGIRLEYLISSNCMQKMIIDKYNFKKMKFNIENIIISVKHLHVYQISALNNS